MHHIQAKILQKLLYVQGSNYAGLRPDKVESNHFAYHLEQLLKVGLLEKHDKSYRLTATGLAYIDRLSQGRMTDRLQPHIVTAIDLTTPDGQTLLFKRSFQPYLHLIGFPLGKMHYEEPIADAAVRELNEKTGLTGIPLTHRGVVYIQAMQGNATTGRVLYHVFHADVAEQLPATAPAERGECFWADHRSLAPEQLMPGFLRVKELLAVNDDLFFEEIAAQI
ncbi:MAG TPA: NUDIX hydrolase [Candidatus Saccharimonadales bacterium]|nr:NUDIX hydrolase [Candidatus Saccharimonadales bacterium]